MVNRDEPEPGTEAYIKKHAKWKIGGGGSMPEDSTESEPDPDSRCVIHWATGFNVACGWCSVKEAADYAGCSQIQIRDWIKQGRLQARRFAKGWRTRSEWIDECIETLPPVAPRPKDLPSAQTMNEAADWLNS